MGGDRVERATARGLAAFDQDRNPNAPAVKPRSRGGCPGGGGLEGSGRSRAGGLRSADRGVELDEVALRARCLQRLARFKVPKRIVVVEAFPIVDSPNGPKVQRIRLREMA